MRFTTKRIATPKTKADKNKARKSSKIIVLIIEGDIPARRKDIEKAKNIWKRLKKFRKMIRSKFDIADYLNGDFSVNLAKNYLTIVK